MKREKVIHLTLQEKTEHLRDAAMLEARTLGNAIMEQHRKALLNVYEQHKAEAVRQSETRIKAETVNVKQQLNMATSKAQLELKRELERRRKSLRRCCFRKCRRRLQNI